MNITIFIKSSPSSGGLETQNELLAKGLDERGHEVKIIKTAAPFGDFQNPPPETDIVISQSAAGTKYLLRRGKKDPPVVVIQHGTLFGSLKTRWRMTPSKKRVLLFVGLIPYAIKAYVLDQLRLRRADVIIAVSDQVANAISTEYLIPRYKIAVVYNGIETDKFVSSSDSPSVIRESLLLPLDSKIVLYVGRIAKEKGLDILVKSVVELTDTGSRIKLLIVGDGPYKSELEKKVKELNLTDKVFFTGKVPYDKVPQYYQAADVFVLPSTAWEGLPMSIIEAMAAGLPVVASRIGGIPNAVIDGQTGLLVRPGTVNELTQALTKLLSDEQLHAKMAISSRNLAEEKFSVETMVEDTLCVMRNGLRGDANLR